MADPVTRAENPEQKRESAANCSRRWTRRRPAKNWVFRSIPTRRPNPKIRPNPGVYQQPTAGWCRRLRAC